MLINHQPLKFDERSPAISGNAFYNLKTIPDLRQYNKIMLEFWRLGCRKCQQSVKDFQEISRQAPDDVLFIAVHYPEMPFEKDPQIVEDFLNENQIKVPVLVDQDGCTANNFGVTVHPARILLTKTQGFKLGEWGSEIYKRLTKLV